MDLQTITGLLDAASPFFLFGVGPRRKLLYRAGVLADACTEATLRRWEVAGETITPSSYRVALTLRDGGEVALWEDEAGVWVEERGRRECLTGGTVRLPSFAGHPHAATLRVLHHDVLLNIVDGHPLPNFLVYSRPWTRDAAMMAMVLERTGNIGLIAPWIMGLRDPFDRNNAGAREADNHGEALYLVSLVSDARHPLVQTVLDLVPQYRRNNHIHGQTDFAEHPVYQTKWLKYGLRRLGLDDPFVIPRQYDSYGTLFWMDFCDVHVPGERFAEEAGVLYPYLAWAEAHFLGAPPPMHLLGRHYPLTWEAGASQASYAGMAMVSEGFCAAPLCAPHTWHAAEALLYLLETPYDSSSPGL